MFASALFANSDTGKRTGAPGGSTYSVDPDGLSAIYAVLKDTGAAGRWEREVRRLPDDADKLVVWDPSTLEDEDWEQLDDWVVDGGTVIIAADDFEVTESKQLAATPAAVHPATLGAGNIATSGLAFLEPPADAMILLTRTDGAPVLMSWTLGDGRYYWSADRAWLTNELIGQKDNLALALGLLTPAKGKQVFFDEYHHGFQAADRWWQLLRGHLQWFVVVLVLATAVLFWAKGARFGAPVPTPAGPARASVEYIFSMSQLYRRARATGIVRQNLYRSLVRDLGRLLGGAQGLSHAEIARRAADRTGLPAAQIQAALDQTAATGAKISDKDLILLSREVEAIQRSVHNAGFRDQQRPGTGAR
ncbi:MAG TPA: DUF4350 domain-containing protein [Symbiobacteriaceae bacterium]|nr:DUF4350 domain-containing protein [Symbiobacteriaceae bacterium]